MEQQQKKKGGFIIGILIVLVLLMIGLVANRWYLDNQMYEKRGNLIGALMEENKKLLEFKELWAQATDSCRILEKRLEGISIRPSQISVSEKKFSSVKKKTKKQNRSIFVPGNYRTVESSLKELYKEAKSAIPEEEPTK